jgi:dTDP-4-amino-4,6-dideoxygalactose transaminase
MIDTGKNSFLMDASSLAKVQTGDYAIILCEIYGYTYDLSRITSLSEKDPILRIVDMAMTVPTRKFFERLSDSDFAFTSFGRGKCMYAGWGGMGFTRDKLLAGKVRKLRDSSLKSCNFALLVKRSMKIMALSLSYEPRTYKFFRKIKDMKRSIRHRSIAHPSGPIINSIAERLSSKDWYYPPTNEWSLPTTYVDRHLMLYNLKNAEQDCEHKKTLARHYHKNLDGVPMIVRPDISSDALSHYTIRVEPSLRPLFQKGLYESNIDGGTLFFFPDSFSKNDYPNASRTASEVINLPLDVRLGIEDIEWISQRVAYVAKHLNEPEV